MKNSDVVVTRFNMYITQLSSNCYYVGLRAAIRLHVLVYVQILFEINAHCSVKQVQTSGNKLGLCIGKSNCYPALFIWKSTLLAKQVENIRVTNKTLILILGPSVQFCLFETFETNIFFKKKGFYVMKGFLSYTVSNIH